MDRKDIYEKSEKISRQIIKIMLREDDGEVADLKEWIQKNQMAKEVTDRLTDPGQLAEGVGDFVRQGKAEELRLLVERIRQRKIRRRIIRFSGAAASVMLLIGVALMYPGHGSDVPVLETVDEHAPILILGSGQNLNLKSSFGDYTADRGTSIRNDQTGEIKYIVGEDTYIAGETEVLNTLVIPRQCMYRVILSDGTAVYVNADSRLEYPVKFIGDERKVRLQGEAYFEVAKSTKPFVVCINDLQVKVYGTKFDINAYHNDRIETVLVEGKVGVAWKGQEKILSPFQLSKVNMVTGEHLVMNVEVDKYVSWTQGYLKYDDDVLERMMEDLSRWYGVDFEFRAESIKAMRVTASINKDLPLSDALSMIQSTIKITFTKQERRYLISYP